MRGRTILLATLGLGLLAGAVVVAAPVPQQPQFLEQRAHSGDGAIDAPVPPVGAPGGPSRVLTEQEMEQWLRGRAVFDHDFRPSEGLGSPDMNGDSCRACHQDPAIGGAGGLELNVSRHGRQDDPEGPFLDPPGGQGLSKLRPPQYEGREEYSDENANVFEQRQSPTLFGGGLIDAIPEAVILANEDPDDSDQDGVRGVARLVETGQGTEVGRFGWKAQMPRLVDFVRDAFGAECGITTTDDGRGFAFLTDADPVGDPELTQQDLDDVVFFLSHLARPAPGGSTSPLRAEGEALFDTLGCVKCHVPSLEGGDGQPVPLYSDLLLHTIMPEDFRGMSEPGAPSGAYRTPPLWGNRATAPYLHDGRAETVDDAIRQHQGEADFARLGYLALTQAERDALLHFLSDI